MLTMKKYFPAFGITASFPLKRYRRRKFAVLSGQEQVERTGLAVILAIGTGRVRVSTVNPLQPHLVIAKKRFLFGKISRVLTVLVRGQRLQFSSFQTETITPASRERFWICAALKK